jgi:molybdopterin-containing oxidoreductase family membrane subunit
MATMETDAQMVREGAAHRGSRTLWAWLAVLVVVWAIGLGAWIYQLSEGLQVTAMRDIVIWGLYIVCFMFFVGLSAGGLIVASAGRIFNVDRFKPIVRLAVLEAAVTILIAAVFILPDLGHPERVLNLVLNAQFVSPLIWDIIVIVTYLVLSVLYVWLYTRRDLAARGSWLALGTKADASEAARARDSRLTKALAWVALPAAVLVHSITAWIFGLQISRGLWYSAIMAPLFVMSALVSGLALVTLLALLARRANRVAFRDDLVAWLGGLLGVFITIQAFFLFCELLAGYYPGVPSNAVRELVEGPYMPLAAIELFVGLAAPWLIVVIPRLRARPGWVALAAVLALAGIFVHRLNTILAGLHESLIPLSPGTPVGMPASNGSSFLVSQSYLPTIFEVLIALGVVAFAALIFTLAAMYLPLREESH